MIDSQGGGAGQSGPETADPYPSEGAGILTPQNGVPPFQHASASITEVFQPGEYAEYSLSRAWHKTGMRGRVSEQPLYQQVQAGAHWLDENWCILPYHPAAFTTDPAGRLVLVTGGGR